MSLSACIGPIWPAESVAQLTCHDVNYRKRCARSEDELDPVSEEALSVNKGKNQRHICFLPSSDQEANVVLGIQTPFRDMAQRE